MKKIALLLTTCFAFCFTFGLYGEVEEEESEPFYPFGINGTCLGVADATFRTPDIKGEQLRYRQGNAGFAYTQPCNTVWGLIFGAGYVGTEVKWQQNPYFDQTHFSYVNLAFGGFTKAMPGWTWTLTETAFIDTAVLDLSDYALYQTVLWGKYDFLECLSFDAGFILEVGLNKGKMWPLIGFEYHPHDDWRVSAVFPLDVSIEYDAFSFVTLAGSLRFLRDRHRVGDDEPLPMGIYEYHVTGAEFDLILTPWEFILIKGFIGRTFQGDLKITDRNNHHATHCKFNAAPYAGVSALLTF